MLVDIENIKNQLENPKSGYSLEHIDRLLNIAIAERLGAIQAELKEMNICGIKTWKQ